MSKRFRSLALFLSLLLVAGLLQAQELLQLGSHSYSRAPAPALRMAVGRGSAFFLAVGGVAFESVAVGRNGVDVVQLEYADSREDGDRLRITLQGPDGSKSQVRARLYDWQLVPIARFAASDHGSAMTLFGSLDDSEFQKELTENGGRAINYHPAFDNTLMGLRLMQADIMLFDENAVYLPRDARGYVLGAGESPPDVEGNRRRFNAISAFLKTEAQNGHPYRSYVTGDLDQRVEFYAKNGIIAFSGRPHWRMWDDPSEVRGAIEDMRHVQARDVQTLIAKYGASAEKIKEALKADEAILKKWEARGRPVETDRGLSVRVSQKVASLEGVNPTVYAALTVVMRYGALFRRYKGRDPEGYAAFVRSLDGIHPLPQVTTPTVQRDHMQ